MFKHSLARSARFASGAFLDRPSRPVDRPRPLIQRLWANQGAEGEVQGELAREPRLALVEAVLFAADEPMTPRKLASLAGLSDAADARRWVARLRELLDADGTAFQVEELAGGYQMLTRATFHRWLTRLPQAGQQLSMSGAARETLTIIAYRQPITRADIEGVRGVGCAEVLRQLMERGLVRIAGRDDSLGRPQLYGTTRKFLQIFGLKSLRDLPRAEGLTPPRGARKPAEAKEEAEGE